MYQGVEEGPYMVLELMTRSDVRLPRFQADLRGIWPILGEGYMAGKGGVRGVRGACGRQTHHSAEACCVDNAWDAYRTGSYTYPAGVEAFQASFAMKEVRTLGMWLLSYEQYRT